MKRAIITSRVRRSLTDVQFNHEDKFLGIFPRISFNEKGNYNESGTKEFDRRPVQPRGQVLGHLSENLVQ